MALKCQNSGMGVAVDWSIKLTIFLCALVPIHISEKFRLKSLPYSNFFQNKTADLNNWILFWTKEAAFYHQISFCSPQIGHTLLFIEIHLSGREAALAWRKLIYLYIRLIFNLLLPLIQ